MKSPHRVGKSRGFSAGESKDFNTKSVYLEPIDPGPAHVRVLAEHEGGGQVEGSHSQFDPQTGRPSEDHARALHPSWQDQVW